MEKIFTLLSKFKIRLTGNIIAILGIIFVSLVLFFTNFTPNTYLVGWDNVMPELNHGLNLSRSFTSIWQEYRGLGVIDAMGHGANLVHSIQIFLLDLILPENTLRYTFTLLMHLAGGLGMFFLVKRLIKSVPLSFLASLFYMLNIGVIQMFFAPLEVFTVHFAALPILTLFILNVIQKGKARDYLILFLASLFFLQQGFVPTIFVVFLIYLAILLLFNLSDRKNFKRIIGVSLVIFCANALWLLPFIFSALTQGGVIESTRINQFSSQEIFFRNKEFGNLFDVLRGHGFMLNTIEYDVFLKQNVYFMEKFRNLTSGLFYNFGAVVLISITLLGLVISFVKRNKHILPFAVTFLVAFFFLANNIPVLSQLNDYVRENIPLFGEAFRFPFTKFIILFMFSYSILLTFGALMLAKFIAKLTDIISLKRVTLSLTIVLSFIIILNAKPAFTGNFVSPYLRLNIPEEYKNTVNYFNGKNSDKRILYLPMHTFWNWQYSDWGHRGSGFLWHGISQPILLRSFDPWSIYNEQLYNEFSYAINTNDTEQFEKLLFKYDISYVIIDGHLINTLSEKPIKYDKLEDFLRSIDSLSKDKSYGKISIYENKNDISFVSKLNTEKTIRTSSKYESNFVDPIIKDTSNYIYDRTHADIESLFTSLSTLKLPKNNEFIAEETANSLVIKPKNLDSKIKNPKLILPSLYKHEFLIPVKVNSNSNIVTFSVIYPDIYINEKKLNIGQETISIPSPVANPTEVTLEDTSHVIRPNTDDLGYLLNNIPNTIRITNGTDTTFIRLDLSDRDGKNIFIELDEPIQTFEVIVPKGSGPLTNWNTISTEQYGIKDSTRNLTHDKNSYTKVSGESAINVESRNDAKSITFYDDDLYHRGSYLVITDINHESGLNPNFFVDNISAGRAESETRLQNGVNFVVLPPTDIYDKGYGFHITVKSEGSEIAKSTIKKLSIFPIPLSTLTNIRIFESDAEVFSQGFPEKEGVEYKKIGTFYYEMAAQDNTILTLSQANDPLWKAYKTSGTLSSVFPFIFAEEIDSKLLVNNWANGWDLSETQIRNGEKIVIVFLPQYLQYAGFALLIICAISILLGNKFYHVLYIFKQINMFFESKTERLREKIMEARGFSESSRLKPESKSLISHPSSINLHSFPYSIDLSDKRRFWKNQ